MCRILYIVSAEYFLTSVKNTVLSYQWVEYFLISVQNTLSQVCRIFSYQCEFSYQCAEYFLISAKNIFLGIICIVSQWMEMWCQGIISQSAPAICRIRILKKCARSTSCPGIFRPLHCLVAIRTNFFQWSFPRKWKKSAEKLLKNYIGNQNDTWKVFNNTECKIKNNTHMHCF